MTEREKVIKALEIHDDRSVDCTECPYRSDDSCFEDLMEDILALLKEQTEIIRCKDCKHSCDYTDIFPDHAYKCIKNGGYHNDSWFCADGERR